jgi:FdhD protein
MKEKIKKFDVLKINGKNTDRIQDTIVREFALTLFLNTHEVTTLICTPSNLEYLAAGYLFSEGLIKEKNHIKDIYIDLKEGLARVITWKDDLVKSNIYPKTLITPKADRILSLPNDINIEKKPPIKTNITIEKDEIYSLMDKFDLSPQIFMSTGGTHSAALCDKKDLLLFREDIGRHNAIDKIFGECILRDIQTDDRILITSGRVSSQTLNKVSKTNLPFLISKSAPTDLGIEISKQAGITLIGFVRGRRMNIYTHDWRVIT